jgi:hypothetical protein
MRNAVSRFGWETFYNTVYTEAAPRISHGHNLSTRQIVETATHPLKVLIANLPWAGFALLTLLPGFSRSFDPRGRRLLQAFHCWTWPSILVWTCLPDHTTRHNFPLFPGLTALAGMAWFGFIMHRLTPRTSQLHRWYAVLTMAAFGLGTVICGVGAFIMLPSAVWWLVVILLVFALWLVKEAVVAFRTERHGWLLATIVLTWVVLKLAFVHFHIPIRGGELRVNQVDLSFLGIDRPLVSPEPRAPRAKGTLLAQHVPPGETLYLRLAKDEGIMFYYGRPVIRVKNWEQLPRQDRPVYCIVDEREWKEFLRRGDWRAESELHLKDEQGDPMVLLGVVRDEPAIRAAQLNSERSRKYDSIE